MKSFLGDFALGEMSDLTPTSRTSAMINNCSTGGCILFTHHLDTVLLFTPIASAKAMLAGKLIAQTTQLVQIDAWQTTLIENLIGTNKISALIGYLVDSLHNFTGGTGDAYFASLSAIEKVLEPHQLAPTMLGMLKPKYANPEFFLAFVEAAKHDYKK